MERLTDWLDEETKTEVSIMHRKMREAMVRLAQYEDTGLTPEEIMEGKLLTGWVPVSERLPGTERVLITNGEFVKEGYRRPDGVWKYGSGVDQLFSKLSSIEVVAWMPLPKVYRPDQSRLLSAGERGKDEGKI